MTILCISDLKLLYSLCCNYLFCVVGVRKSLAQRLGSVSVTFDSSISVGIKARLGVIHGKTMQRQAGYNSSHIQPQVMITSN